MRQIFKIENEAMSAAWIGGSAPIPDGWHLDVNSAKEAANAVRKEERQGPEEVRAHNDDGTFKADDPATPEVNEAWKPQRGRPRKQK